MAYEDFEDSPRTASDKVLRDKAFNIGKNPKHHGYQHELASMAFDKTSAVSNTSGNAIKSKPTPNQRPLDLVLRSLIVREN